MDRISGLNANQAAKELQGYKRYKNKTQKEIKEKVGGVTSLRDELKRLEKKEKDKKEKKSPKEKVDPLIYITQIGVEYYKDLDFVDLKNLCRTSKELNNICHNNFMLKQIIDLYVKFPKNYDIAEAFNQLYTNISQLISKNYPDIPKYIIKDLFMDDMIRKVYKLIYFHLLDFVYEHVYDLDLTHLKNKIKLNKLVLAMPFVADAANLSETYFEFDDLKEHDAFEEVENVLILPDSFIDYLKTIFAYWKNSDYKVDWDNDLLSVLMLKNSRLYA